MDNDDDFTFCQAGLPVEKNGPEAEILASDIGGIIITDGFSNGTNSSQGGGVWRDSLPSDADSKDERTVGSLSFNVIDASARGESSGVPRQVASGNAGTSAVKFDEKKVSARKPVARSKVPFEKGFSQMDWLKLTRTHPDLAGLKGQSNKRLISMDEVKQHQTEGSMWTVLKGRVYNLSPYLNFHPGGADILMKAVGKDCTSLFTQSLEKSISLVYADVYLNEDVLHDCAFRDKYHAWVNAEFLLEKCLVGTLDVGQ
ncbi:hypothetical protein SADUNF_Sadunf16G0151200 [Salix dunnii]|uniref:Cytochrome b5 heme-binding domain-containing protein n=1 Tax=Salix dunnii TaxID=1413687 RepID=A0A835JBA3_9ROSI|nr:hypothetical protein SADUNF_Sadunf16G0151200 [Salix dunnii]